MKRRNFLGLISLFSLTYLNLKAEDYQITKPDVWTAKTIEDAIKELYGTNLTIEDSVTLIAPDIPANAGSIHIDIQSDIPAKSVALFQSSNPESAVCIFSLNENMLIDFFVKIKLKKSGILKVIVEGLDGNLYSATKSIEIYINSCDGTPIKT